MSEIERFEDIIAWQKARALTKAVYEITRQGSFAKDFGLASQIQRAAVSIMSNIAEGFERSGRASGFSSSAPPKRLVRKSAPSYTRLLMSATCRGRNSTVCFLKPKKSPAWWANSASPWPK